MWVHQEVSSQVIKHDCVVSGVLRILAPDDAQRLHIHEAVLLRLHGDHGAAVQVEGQLVVGVGGAAQQLHLLLDPLHISGGPEHEILSMGCILNK